MNTLKTIALILVIIGGLNWGLIGLFSFDLVANTRGISGSLVTARAKIAA